MLTQISSSNTNQDAVLNAYLRFIDLLFAFALMTFIFRLSITPLLRNYKSNIFFSWLSNLNLVRVFITLNYKDDSFKFCILLYMSWRPQLILLNKCLPHAMNGTFYYIIPLLSLTVYKRPQKTVILILRYLYDYIQTAFH